MITAATLEEAGGLASVRLDSVFASSLVVELAAVLRHIDATVQRLEFDDGVDWARVGFRLDEVVGYVSTFLSDCATGVRRRHRIDLADGRRFEFGHSVTETEPDRRDYFLRQVARN